jgi:hypothetical protein
VPDDTPEPALPQLYDVDLGLREIARQRGRRDTLTCAQVQLGDALAEYVNRHFSPEEVETAGRALLIAASSSGSLITEGVTRPEIIINVIGFAAARMVTDGRAWADAGEAESGS